MGKGAIAIGIVCILAGLYWTYEVITSPDVPNWLLIHLSILIITGIGLIVFFREENKIEQRKDINNKKDK
jgi:ABC-type nickel/cobalt efflux system permease component RcnA